MKQLNLKKDQDRLRDKFLKSGVKMAGPETIYFSKDIKIGKNVTIEPYVVFGSKVKIGSNVLIRSFSHLENCIVKESTLINGVKDFLIWAKKKNISMGVCTNKQEHLAVDLLKKIGIYDFFEYVAGHNTFNYCKPDPRHLTSVIEILDGDIKRSLMIGDSETDANAAKEAGIPVILLEDGYTEKNTSEIYHNHLIRDFVGIEKIVLQYL